jgi:hypothetical protein
MQTRLSALTNIKKNLQLAQDRMKKFTDKKCSERELAMGEMAYLKLQPYRHSALGLQSQSSSIQNIMVPSKCDKGLAR